MMKHIFFVGILLFFQIAFCSWADQFAIDLLTGKDTIPKFPCSGPPGSGCENIVPSASLSQRPEQEFRDITPQMTPIDPIQYARQQIPTYPADIYRDPYASLWQVPASRIPAYGPHIAVPEISLRLNFVQDVDAWNRQKLAKFAIKAERIHEQAIAKHRAREAAWQTAAIYVPAPSQEPSSVPTVIVSQDKESTSALFYMNAFVKHGILLVAILIFVAKGWKLLRHYNS